MPERNVPLPLAAVALLLLSAGCLQGTVEVPAQRDLRLSTYLDARRFPTMVVEIDHMESVPPAPAAIEHLVDALRKATARDDVVVGVTAFPDDPSPPATPREWSTEALDALARRERTLAEEGTFSRGDAAVVHVLYVRGSWAEGNANGLATGRAAFLFASEDVLPSLRGEEDPALVERAVLLHEVGHLLGLVNDGVPMVSPHEDPGSRHHSSDPASVMTASVDAFDALVGRVDEGQAPPSAFDAQDLEDLAAFRASLQG